VKKVRIFIKLDHFKNIDVMNMMQVTSITV